MSFHDSIHKHITALGYSKSEGCCHGFTIRWMEAYLEGKGKIFKKRIKKILNHENSLIEKIDSAKKKKGINLTAQDNEMLDINAFYESLELFHSPEEYALFFNKPLNQNDIEEISYLASSEVMQKKGGLKNIFSHPGIYTKDELKQYIDELTLHINNLKPAMELPLGFILASSNHTIGLIYRPKIGWMLMDINEFPAKHSAFYQTDLIADFIITGLKNKQETLYTAFNTSIFTLGSNERLNQLKKHFDSFKKTQHITKNMINREDDVGLAYIAVTNNHIDVMEELKNFEVDFKKQDLEEKTFAHYAAERGYTEVIEKLAQYKVDFNIKNKHGDTASYAAAHGGYVNVIRKLYEYGADFNLSNKDGETPAYIAAYSNHAEVIHLLYRYKADLNKADNNGRTPAYTAAWNGHIEVIHALAECKVDFNIADNEERTPAFKAAELGYANIIELFGQLNVDLNKPDNKGNTPAFMAAKYGHVDVIKVLGEQGANLSKPNSKSITPALIATSNSHYRVINELIKQGVDVNAPCRISVNLLKRMLCKHETNKQLAAFIKKQSNVPRKKIRITPLDIAFIINDKKLINLLKENIRQKRPKSKQLSKILRKREFASILDDLTNQSLETLEPDLKNTVPLKKRKVNSEDKENITFNHFQSKSNKLSKHIFFQQPLNKQDDLKSAYENNWLFSN